MWTTKWQTPNMGGEVERWTSAVVRHHGEEFEKAVYDSDKCKLRN